MVGGICIGKVNVKFRAKTTDTYVKSACNKPQHVVSAGPEELRPGGQGGQGDQRAITLWAERVTGIFGLNMITFFI